jgi:hypothetical protein
MCQICLTIFLAHGVPNTPQVKPTEDNCEAYFTQHVSNVTLCRCQIYSEFSFAQEPQMQVKFQKNKSFHNSRFLCFSM